MDGVLVSRSGLDDLISDLTQRGYEVLGPTRVDGAIVYDRIGSTADLPVGWGDEQGPGGYRLVDRGDEGLFGYTVGPMSWKRFLFPPREDLFTVSRSNGTLAFNQAEITAPERAFFGVRACELAAIGIQDRVFLESGFVDPGYAERRRSALVVVVECGTAGGTCFCASMGTGPGCSGGFDLAITELPGDPIDYLVRSGSAAGAALLDGLGGRPAGDADFERARRVVEQAAASMGRSLEVEGIRDLLVDGPEHPRWSEVAERCLACGNCTLACPTCFCSTTVDRVSLDGDAARSRRWDSCFGLDFSGLHGHSVRATVKSRYRQWMTHKLATWHDQFGSSGCVGCGRCITWCPVGIDITQEVRAIREEAVR